MGLDPKSLPESFLRCLPKEQREEANLPPTFEEATEIGVKREEILKLQIPFLQWLVLHGYLFIRPREDRKTTIQKGWPDFTVLRGRTGGREGSSVICVEFKWPGAKLKPDQAEARNRIEADGIPYLLAYDVASAIAFVKLHLDKKEAAPVA